jgi:hypothetical protein
MNRSMIRLVLGAALAVPVLAASASPASAETVTLGSTLAGNFDGGVTGTGQAVSVQLAYDPGTSPNPVVSPADGMITGWKVKSADDGALYTLKVLRPNGPVSLVTMTNSNFTAVGSVPAPSAVPVGTGATTPTGEVFSYPASLPIKKGDYVGMLLGGAPDGLPQAFTNGVHANLIANNFGGQPADGTSANLLADEQHDLLLQATIEFTPPGNPGSSKTPGTAKKKCKKSKKKKRSAEVTKKKKCKKKKKKG